MRKRSELILHVCYMQISPHACGGGWGKKGLSVKIQMAFDHRIIIKKLVERIVIDQIYT